MVDLHGLGLELIRRHGVILLVPGHIVLVLLAQGQEEGLQELVDLLGLALPGFVLLCSHISVCLLLDLLAVLGAVVLLQRRLLLLVQDVLGARPERESRQLGQLLNRSCWRGRRCVQRCARSGKPSLSQREPEKVRHVMPLHLEAGPRRQHTMVRSPEGSIITHQRLS